MMNDPKTPRTEDECEFWLRALFAGRTCGFALKLATKKCIKKGTVHEISSRRRKKALGPSVP